MTKELQIVTKDDFEKKANFIIETLLKAGWKTIILDSVGKENTSRSWNHKPPENGIELYEHL